MKHIVVNDTNVFIDLLDVGLLEEFFLLSWEIHTTDFVMMELRKEGQKEAVGRFAIEGRLHIASFEADEILNIRSLHKRFDTRTNVSLTDCSVWYYAKTNHYSLLTGDHKLRISSQNDGVDVHGILYVFDTLVDEEVVSCEMAASKLRDLQSLNPRLPKDEIEKRLNLWENKNKKGESL